MGEQWWRRRGGRRWQRRRRRRDEKRKRPGGKAEALLSLPGGSSSRRMSSPLGRGRQPMTPSRARRGQKNAADRHRRQDSHLQNSGRTTKRSVPGFRLGLDLAQTLSKWGPKTGPPILSSPPSLSPFHGPTLTHSDTNSPTLDSDMETQHEMPGLRQ